MDVATGRDTRSVSSSDSSSLSPSPSASIVTSPRRSAEKVACDWVGGVATVHVGVGGGVGDAEEGVRRGDVRAPLLGHSADGSLIVSALARRDNTGGFGDASLEAAAAALSSSASADGSIAAALTRRANLGRVIVSACGPIVWRVCTQIAATKEEVTRNPALSTSLRGGNDHESVIAVENVAVRCTLRMSVPRTPKGMSISGQDMAVVAPVLRNLRNACTPFGLHAFLTFFIPLPV